MKILITGVNGQLGSELYSTLKHENYGVDLSLENPSNNLFKIDLAYKENVLGLVEKVRPEWVVHCAALTNPDACETDMENAWKCNVIGTKNIVEACNKFNSKMIFISTDYVFDGTKGLYKEDDKVNPINFYGKTKVIGEWLTRTINGSIIIRTSMLLSNRQRSILNWVVESLEKGDVTAATDMIGSPTLVSELAEAISKVIENNLSGIYHMAGDKRISRYEFMRKIAKIYDYEENKVKPTDINEIGFKSPRPKDTSLDITKVKNLGFRFSKIEDAIRKLRDSKIK